MVISCFVLLWPLHGLIFFFWQGFLKKLNAECDTAVKYAASLVQCKRLSDKTVQVSEAADSSCRHVRRIAVQVPYDCRCRHPPQCQQHLQHSFGEAQLIAVVCGKHLARLCTCYVDVRALLACRDAEFVEVLMLEYGQICSGASMHSFCYLHSLRARCKLLMKQRLCAPNSQVRFGSRKKEAIMILLPIHHPPSRHPPHVTRRDVRNRTCCGLSKDKTGLKEEAVTVRV